MNVLQNKDLHVRFYRVDISSILIQEHNQRRTAEDTQSFLVVFDSLELGITIHHVVILSLECLIIISPAGRVRSSNEVLSATTK